MIEAGLGFTCDFNKVGGFIGMDHVVKQKSEFRRCGLTKRMVSILVNDPDPLMQHSEVIWRNGIRISDVRAASYGHTLGGAVGLSMIESVEPISKDYIYEGVWEVEIASKRYPCQVSLLPFYDPKGERIKL